MTLVIVLVTIAVSLWFHLLGSVVSMDHSENVGASPFFKFLDIQKKKKKNCKKCTCLQFFGFNQ